MRNAAFATFHGQQWPGAGREVVHEFLERRRLFKNCGLTTNLNSLPTWKLDAFTVISITEDEVKAQKQSAASRKTAAAGGKPMKRSRRR